MTYHLFMQIKYAFASDRDTNPPRSSHDPWRMYWSSIPCITVRPRLIEDEGDAIPKVMVVVESVSVRAPASHETQYFDLKFDHYDH